MANIPERKVKFVEKDGIELEYPEEIDFALEEIFSKTQLFGQQNLLDVLNFIRNNASIVNYLTSSDTLVTNNTGTYLDIPDMTLTPDVAGQYIIMAFAVTSHSLNNGLAEFALTENGVINPTTETNIAYNAKNTSLVVPMIKIANVNGTTDTISMQYRDISGTVRATNRYLFMLRISE